MRMMVVRMTGWVVMMMMSSIPWSGMSGWWGVVLRWRRASDNARVMYWTCRRCCQMMVCCTRARWGLVLTDDDSCGSATTSYGGAVAEVVCCRQWIRSWNISCETIIFSEIVYRNLFLNAGWIILAKIYTSSERLSSNVCISALCKVCCVWGSSNSDSGCAICRRCPTGCICWICDCIWHLCNYKVQDMISWLVYNLCQLKLNSAEQIVL